MWDYIKDNWILLVLIFFIAFFLSLILGNAGANSMRLLDEPPSGCVEVAAPFQGGSE